VETTLSAATTIDGFTITNGDGGISALLSMLVIENCRLVGNHASISGGGLRVDHSDVRLVNTVVGSNQADLNDGAMHIMSSVSIPGPASSVWITNSTIVNNAALGGRHGVYSVLSTCSVYNSILWGHESEDLQGDGISATYSDIEMGFAGDGNISAEPRLVDPANNDYHLGSESPCVDAGNNVGAPQADYDGISRPIDGDGDGSAIVDMGAAERMGFEIYMPAVVQND
jgi:hypothetical protein